VNVEYSTNAVSHRSSAPDEGIKGVSAIVIVLASNPIAFLSIALLNVNDEIFSLKNFSFFIFCNHLFRYLSTISFVNTGDVSSVPNMSVVSFLNSFHVTSSLGADDGIGAKK